MGYTHYWTVTKASDVCFQALVEDARRIIAATPVLICGGLGRGKPELTASTLRFNGSEARGEDYETFAMYSTDETWNFCKTAEMPYDEIVCAVLIAAKEHYRDNIDITSDGTWAEWTAGRDLYKLALNRTPRKAIK